MWELDRTSSHSPPTQRNVESPWLRGLVWTFGSPLAKRLIARTGLPFVGLCAEGWREGHAHGQTRDAANRLAVRLPADRILGDCRRPMVTAELRIGSHRPPTGGLRTMTLGTSNSSSSMNATNPSGPNASGISVAPVA